MATIRPIQYLQLQEREMPTFGRLKTRDILGLNTSTYLDFTKASIKHPVS